MTKKLASFLSKYEKAKNNLLMIIKKNRSVNLGSILLFCLRFLLGWAFYSATLFYATKLSFKNDISLTYGQIFYVVVGGLVLLTITYFREYFSDRKKNRLLKDEKIIYNCIEGAIHELIELKNTYNKHDPNYIYQILRYIEKIIDIVLRSEGLVPGDICVNLMIREGDPDKLVLKCFGTFMPGRDKPTLLINKENPLPGAPEACVMRKTIYIDDIKSDKYKEYFKKVYPFQSIISIPIYKDDEDVVGIINIDSTLPDQFLSSDFIARKIVPKINPLIMLFLFERDLFNK